MGIIKDKFSTKWHNPVKGARDILKFIGPGLLVTVGFIDPGNWASNMAAGRITVINFSGWSLCLRSC